MPSGEKLRRRVHALERAHSDDLLLEQKERPPPGLVSTSSAPDIKHKQERTSSTLAESSENISEDGEEMVEEDETTEGDSELGVPPSRPMSRRPSQTPPRAHTPTPKPALERRPTMSRRATSYHEPPSARAWYQFDTAVLFALVSPIGNWLTGGEWVANVLLVLFLLFYLHQIIEVPWNLYQSSMPRNTPDSSPDPHTVDVRLSSELRRHELFYLLLAVISPFLGAQLIHYILGDSISWFSTALFVLATGIRPWTHLADRLSSRVHTLHTQIHYPPPSHVENDELRDEILELRAELREMERRLRGEVKDGVEGTLVEREEDMCHYIDECVEKMGRRMDRRVRDVEMVLKQVQQHQQHQNSHVKKRGGPQHAIKVQTTQDYGLVLRTWIWVISWLPDWLAILLHFPPSQMQASPTKPSPRSPNNLRSPRIQMNGIKSMPVTSFTSSSVSGSLDTIPEDEDDYEEEVLARSSPVRRSSEKADTSRHLTGNVDTKKANGKSRRSKQESRGLFGRMWWNAIYVVAFPLRLFFRLG